MELSLKKYLTLITIWYILGYIFLTLFLFNFFPAKIKSHKTALDPPLHLNFISLDRSENYQPKVDRIILIVIDGLRYDFVKSEKMPYVVSEIPNNGCLIPTKAEAPTVTMPRIKAITTGSVPQFIDIVLNFASTEITEDSFLHRAKHAQKKMIFYGDDTWLKLFPNMFLRSEGTNSFFVTDFTEVDNNVTRNVAKELKKTDWDIMILHYLGLDHIGHTHGPNHPLINDKLQEMDDIIEKIHTSIQKDAAKSTIIICGDHGMKDTGGHGGSSPGETLVPLIFLELSCHKSQEIITQTDIAPTLSALMGIQIPADSIGRIITEVMQHNIEHLLYLMHYNALSLLQIDHSQIYHFQDLIDRYYFHLNNPNRSVGMLFRDYKDQIVDVSNTLISSSTVQNIPFLYLTLTAMFVILLSLFQLQYKMFFFQIVATTLCFTIVLFCFPNNSIVASITVNYCYLIILIAAFKLPNVFCVLSKFTLSPYLLFLLLGTILRTVLLMSSSYIEEEHQIWYYLFGTATLLGGFKAFQSEKWMNLCLWMILFVGLRIIRNLNHSGIQNNFPGFSYWLQQSDYNMWMIVIFLIGLFATAIGCSSLFKDKTLKILSYATSFSIFWYRNALYYDKHTVFEARITMLLIIICGIVSYIRYSQVFKSFSIMWMLWIALLMRPFNVILIPICFYACHILNKVCWSKKYLTFLHLWLAYVLFHCQGFGNSLNSVDVSAGYVGLKKYDLFFTSVQVICHTYSFHILSMILLFSNCNFSEQLKSLHTVIIFRIFSVTYYCLVMILHRQHLFIWSVFSPKLLIEFCHSTLLFIVVSIYFLLSCMNKNQVNVY